MAVHIVVLCHTLWSAGYAIDDDIADAGDRRGRVAAAAAAEDKQVGMGR